jgi:hypothetical protein
MKTLFEEPAPSLDRLYEARERRRLEQERRKAKQDHSLSLSEYHEAKYAERKPRLQQTANLAYPKLKGRG